MQYRSIAGITEVRTKEEALRVVDQLETLPSDRFHAWDTEVSGIDAASQSPVGNGTVICASLYCGPDVDFGNGPRVWIDNMDDAEGTLLEFKGYMANRQFKKVFHNYGFDRHVLFNESIDCVGLGADTMHMARMWDTSRAKKGGYSLESLSDDLLGHRKAPMKERFAIPKLKKDGTPGKERILPPVEDIQRNPQTREDWIDYSTFDAESTWHVQEILQQYLCRRHWAGTETMWDFYQRFIVPFAEVLTDMERAGIQVDVRHHLPAAEEQARAERLEAERTFLQWVVPYCPDAARMNVGSDVQKAHLLFAPARRLRRPGFGKDTAGQGETATTRSPPGDNPWRGTQPIDENDADADDGGGDEDENGEASLVLSREAVEEAKEAQRAARAAENNPDVWPRERNFKVENVEGVIEPGKKKAKKQRDITLIGLGIPPVTRTAAGWPAVSAAVLRALAGHPFDDPPRCGIAYEHFGGGDAGKKACEAIDALHNASAIDTMLSNFLVPLQAMADANGRVHCSLNLNTETGRLSARRPNLQNQPALEKDRYGVRKAFQARPGNRLIVADYGQLELRVLAHMTKCQSMLEAFRAGGDFHSRTAMGMYPHIADKVDRGEVILEWDDTQGSAPDVPLLKNAYASERRKAKILNFSIAYGKTAVGLSKDWGVSLQEAKETLERWYEDRPEVRAWQQRVLDIARADQATRTLMGRYRDLPDINAPNRRARGHAERAAINTPIQGGAADVVMMAMLKIARDERLKRLGWEMLLQIHDEVILEGPTESADDAMRMVMEDMERPFEKPLLVDLVVDAAIADNWYDAK